MVYKTKVFVLSVTAAALALIYAGTLLLTAERLNARSAAYTWLEPRWADQAARVEISSGGETVALVCRNAFWYVETAGVEYPAKQGRVADLLRVLSTRAAYPVRGSAASSHERLGLTEDAASRIVVRPGGLAGAGTPGSPEGTPGSPSGNRPLLDLLIGTGGAAGAEVFLRINGRSEVRSGEDRFTVYLSPSPVPWYDLRLFPQDASPQGGALSLDMVQRVTVVAPGSAAPLVVTRDGAGWSVDGLTADSLDASRVAPFIRAVLDAEGEGFAAALSPEDPVFNEGSIRLELGDGSSRTVRLGPLVQSGEGGTAARAAVVAGSPYVYALAGWTADRLFRDAASFSR